MFKMFNKNTESKFANTNIDINQLVTIDGYNSADGSGNLRVIQVPTLTIFSGFNPKKESGITALICSARILDEEKKKVLGSRVIVVSKKFMKLPKKQKLALIAIENSKVAALEDRYVSKVESGTNLDKTVGATLSAIEEFGPRATLSGVKKNTKLIQKGEKKVGGYMFKEHKKAAKIIKKQKIEKIDPSAVAENFVDAVMGNDGTAEPSQA